MAHLFKMSEWQSGAGDRWYCGDTEDIGLDRIDNTKGHTKDNVVPCCYICNTTRGSNFTYEEMKIIGKTIKEIKRCRLEKMNSKKNMG